MVYRVTGSGASAAIAKTISGWALIWVLINTIVMM